jgi:hypothetical protein
MSCRGSRRLLLMRDGISGRWASSGLSGPVANPWAWRVPSLFRVRGNLRITKTRLTQLSVRLGQADRVGERTSPLERAASARTGAMTGARAEGREWRDRRGGESKTVNINRCSHNRRATCHNCQLTHMRQYCRVLRCSMKLRSIIKTVVCTVDSRLALDSALARRLGPCAMSCLGSAIRSFGPLPPVLFGRAPATSSVPRLYCPVATYWQPTPSSVLDASTANGGASAKKTTE